jgi:hypothetical protein
MLVLAVTHVHLYPCHDTVRLLECALGYLEPGRRDGVLRILALTERHDCHAFRDLADGALRLPAPWSLAPSAEPAGLVLARDGAPRLCVVAGRQVVTRERIEVLALGADADVPDGLPAAEALACVRAGGAIPVLSWAPGKWFFARGRIVRDLLLGSDPAGVAVGDTSLRPTVWPLPGIMAEASRRGFRVVAGSDPLPFAGDERYAGSYAVAADFAASAERPVAALRRLVLDPGVALSLRGRRCGALAVAARLRHNARSKRA